MAAGLHIGFELDRRWHSLRGEMEQSKKPALLALAEILAEVSLRFIGKVDLLHEKLRAGADPARRRSKRLQGLADAQGLLEGDASLLQHLSQRERELLATLPP